MPEGQFDVFLSYNGAHDRESVEQVARRLRSEGLEPWFDRWRLTAGGNWQQECLAGLQRSRTCAVFLGPNGIGPWEWEELAVALDRAAKDRSFRVFPVLLPALPDPFDSSMLPPFLSTRTWIDLRNEAEGRGAVQELINAVNGVAPGAPAAGAPMVTVCPYLGLQAFDEERAMFFFGRAREVQEMVEALKATRFLSVAGASGIGKSSLVRAGLIPALRRGALPGSEAWLIRTLTPGPHPLTTLAANLVELRTDASMQRTLDEVANDPRTLHLAAALAVANKAAGLRLLLVVDQFEEVFSACKDRDERDRFVSNLVFAASIPDGPCIVVITLRADFYGAVTSHPQLAAAVNAHQFLVAAMGPEGLRMAIEEPARVVGLEFEEGLIETILDKVEGEPGSLPLLEHALLELWKRRRGSMLTLEGYRQAGGVEGAVASRAEAIYSGFTPEQQEIARRILLRLTRPGEGTEPTRRRASMAELVGLPEQIGSVEHVVAALANARLLTLSGDAPAETGEALGGASPVVDTGPVTASAGEEAERPWGSDRWVDISHEALIRGWPRLRDWLGEDRAGLRIQHRLTEAAKEWERSQRDPSLLFRGSRLSEVVVWLERPERQVMLNELERSFVRASVEAQISERDRELERARREAAVHRSAARRLRWVAVALVMGLIASGMATIVAVRALHTAHANQKVAMSEGLAAQAIAQLRFDPRGALATAEQSIERGPPRPLAAAMFAVRKALAGNLMLHQAGGSGSSAVLAAAFAGSDAVVTVAADASAHRFDLKGWTDHPLLPPTGTTAHGGALGAVLSPDGSLAVVTRGDGSVELWRLDGSGAAPVEALPATAGPMRSAAFSADGQRVAVVSARGTATVFDLTGRVLIQISPLNTGAALLSAALSADGRRLAVGSGDGRVLIYSVPSHGGPQPLQAGMSAVFALSFSPDGTLLASGSADHETRLWDLSPSGAARVVHIQQDFVRSVAVTNAGVVASASDDHTAVVGPIDGRSHNLVGDTAPVRSAVFSSDGRGSGAQRTARTSSHCWASTRPC